MDKARTNPETTTATSESEPSRAPRPTLRPRPSRAVFRYLSGEILKIFLLTFTCFEVIYGAIVAIKAVREYSFDLFMIVPILKSTFAYELYFAIPVALLFATALVFGRLVADQEVAAFRSLGFSNLQLLQAPLALGLLLCVSCYFINGYLVPDAKKQIGNADQLILSQMQYLGEGWNKKFVLGRRSGNTLLIKYYNKSRLQHLIMYIENPSKLQLKGFEGYEATSFPFVLYARRGEVLEADEGGPGLFLELRDVNIYFDQDLIDKAKPGEPGGNLLNRVRISRMTVPLQPEASDRDKLKYMINPTLMREFDRLERVIANSEDEKEVGKARARLRKANAENQRRLAFSLICLTFPLAVALIALSLNSSNRFTPFFVGVLTSCLIFFPLEEIGATLSFRLGAAWFFLHLGNFALLLLATVLWLRLEKRRPVYWPRRARKALARERRP